MIWFVMILKKFENTNNPFKLNDRFSGNSRKFSQKQHITYYVDIIHIVSCVVTSWNGLCS